MTRRRTARCPSPSHTRHSPRRRTREPDAPAAPERVNGERWAGLDAGAAERLVVSKSAAPLLVEQFGSLAASLLATKREHAISSIIVTSASPGDGKSYVAVNLALTLSESYRRRVLLIDADLRQPSLHAVFGVPATPGLGDALKALAPGDVPVVPINETLTLLPGGHPDRDPLAGLSSDRMKRIVADAGSRFDWVIVDSPPVGVLADGRLVSETVDAAILVVRAGVTRFVDLEAAAETMGRDRILGVVLNAVDPVEIRAKDYYRYYYGREGRREDSSG